MAAESKERIARGLDVLSTLGGSKAAAEGMAAFFAARGAVGQLALEVGAGEVWSRTGLARRDRSLVVIAFLAALGREVELRAHVAGGLNHGLTVAKVDELFVQLAGYAGLPFALAGAAIADAVIAEREGGTERKAPRAALAEKSAAARRRDGLDVLRTLLGLPAIDGAAVERQILESQGAMGELVLDYAFGEIWSRPALSRRDRSLAVVSVLAALGKLHELEFHLQGALHHGVTRAELEEMLLTLVVYGGFPRAIDAASVAKRVFERAGRAQ